MKDYSYNEVLSYFFGVRQVKLAAKTWLAQYRSFRQVGKGRRWSARMATKVTHAVLRTMNVVRP